MRLFPLALIAIGVFGLLKHFGLIDAAVLQLAWPLLLIGIGVALLVRGPRSRAEWQDRMQNRWERRLHRHFGPGWADLTDDERERFRAGMQQWRSHRHGGTWAEPGAPEAPASAGGAAPSPAPGEPR